MNNVLNTVGNFAKTAAAAGTIALATQTGSVEAANLPKVNTVESRNNGVELAAKPSENKETHVARGEVRTNDPKTREERRRELLCPETHCTPSRDRREKNLPLNPEDKPSPSPKPRPNPKPSPM